MSDVAPQVSDQIIVPPDNVTARKSSTTISTIVVQSSETRVVVALLKSGEKLTFRILEMSPKLTSLGSDVNESEQLLNDHEIVIAKLEKKQTPVENMLGQVDALVSNENPEVYVAMAQSLGEAWSDLNLKLGNRREILSLGHSFHGYRLDCLDSFRKYDNSLRKDTLRNYSKAVDTGCHLIDKLKTLEDSWESILRVNYWLDDLRLAMIEWKAELQRRELKEKEAKIYNDYLEELARIKHKHEEYSLTRTELLSMFTRIDMEFKLSPPKKKELELKVYEMLQSITAEIETLENVKSFIEKNNKLDSPHFKEDYLEKLEQLKELDADLSSKLKKRLKIREDFDNILATICNEDSFDEKSIKEKLSEDETLDITSALETIRRKFNGDELGVYDIFKERIQLIEASIKEGGELQDYILLNDIVQEVETDCKNAKDFHKKDELLQKCKNLEAIIQHRLGILQEVKTFINENKDLSDDLFRAEHVKALRRLTDSKDGRILSCILRNRLTVRNVYELILKNPLHYEEEEIVDLISVDQTLETTLAVEKIMSRRRLLELLKTLDFPLPENLAIAKSDLVDFESFEDMVANLSDPPEELIEKTNAKKTKILKCIQYFELLDDHDKPDEIEMLAALEIELFGTTHWIETLLNMKNADKNESDDKIEELKPQVLTSEPSRPRDSISEEESSNSQITSIEVLTDGEIVLEEDADRGSTATPSLNLSDAEFYIPIDDSESEERFETPISETTDNKSLDELLKPETKMVDVVIVEEEGQIFFVPQDLKEDVDITPEQPSETGPIHQNHVVGDDSEIVSIKSSESEQSTNNEILRPIRQIPIEVEVLRITETPVELQNIGMETQIVQEPPEVEDLGPVDQQSNGASNQRESDTQIVEVSMEFESIGMESQMVEEPQEVEAFETCSGPDHPNDRLGLTSPISEEFSGLDEATVVTEPMQLKHIGKQTIIIEEPIMLFSELPEDQKVRDVKVISEEFEVVSDPESITLSKTITLTKTPQEIANEKVEALLDELQELRNVKSQEFLASERSDSISSEDMPISELIQNSVQLTHYKNNNILQNDERPFQKDDRMNAPDKCLGSTSADSSPSANPGDEIKTEIPDDLKSPEVHQINLQTDSSDESKPIPIPEEITASQKSNPEIAKTNNLGNLSEKIKAFVDDIITVETETLEFETSMQLVIGNTAPSKSQSNIETQTDELISALKPIEIQIPNEEDTTVEPIAERSFENLGSAPAMIEQKIANEQPEATTPNILQALSISTNAPPSPNKPPPNKRPPGLSSPRKSAFVETLSFGPRNLSAETQTSPLTDKQQILPQGRKFEPICIINPLQSFAESPSGNKAIPGGWGIKESSPVTNEFATGMAYGLLDEIRHQLEEALLAGSPMSPSEQPGAGIEHPVGLLQIMKAENAANPKPISHEVGTSPIPPQVLEYQPTTAERHLEGFKSPVQEVETQTLEPIPVLNSETQTVNTLKRLDSSSTQTISDQVKTTNIQTQTDSSSPLPKCDQSAERIVKSPANYFAPNVIFEKLAGTQSPGEVQYIDDDKTFCGISEKIRIFENSPQNNESSKQENFSQHPQTEAFIPIRTPSNSNTETQIEREIVIIRPVPKVVDIQTENGCNAPNIRSIEIKIPYPETAKSPVISPKSPYSVFTDYSTSPSEFRTPTPTKSGPSGESRVIEIKLPKSHEIPIKIRQETVRPSQEKFSQQQQPQAGEPPLYPWRKSSAGEDLAIPAMPATTQSEAMMYTFGHFEETKETLPPGKQPSVRDRVKYWEPRTSISETLIGMDSKLEDEVAVPGGDAPDIISPTVQPSGVGQYRLLFQSPTSGTDYCDESVANAIQERQKELAQYKQAGTVSEFRKLFQSIEQTTTTSAGGKEIKESKKSFITETFPKVPIPPTPQENVPTIPVQQPKVPTIQRRHSETISASTTNLPKPDEVPQEGTVARFKRLFQSFETSEKSHETSQRPAVSNLHFPGKRADQGRNELVTSPPGFRVFERYLSPSFPQREYVHEESQSQTHKPGTNEWTTTERKVFRSCESEGFTESPLSPTLRPTKFVPGEFQESDYESDYECKIAPVWVPPSSSRPPSSREFRSITPNIPVEHKPTPPSAFGPIREIPIQTSDVPYFAKSPTGTKPIPPPKPMSRKFQETSLTSKITKTQETKFMLKPIRSPQPSDSEDELSVRRIVSPTSPPPSQWNPPKTTTRIYKTQQLIEKRNE